MAKKSPMARTGKSNGRWKGGVSKTYYRKKAGAKTGDGKVVHHKTYKKSNLTKKSNYKLVTRGDHNKIHPDRSKKSGRINKKAESKSSVSENSITLTYTLTFTKK
jgi:uncharacterized protein YgiB involved in biofilm formation